MNGANNYLWKIYLFENFVVKNKQNGSSYTYEVFFFEKNEKNLFVNLILRDFVINKLFC